MYSTIQGKIDRNFFFFVFQNTWSSAKSHTSKISRFKIQNKTDPEEKQNKNSNIQIQADHKNVSRPAPLRFKLNRMEDPMYSELISFILLSDNWLLPIHFLHSVPTTIPLQNKGLIRKCINPNYNHCHKLKVWARTLYTHAAV